MKYTITHVPKDFFMRRGRIVFDKDEVRLHPGIALAILRDLLPISVTSNWLGKSVWIDGLHPAFDALELEEEIPIYAANVKILEKNDAETTIEIEFIKTTE